MMRHRVRGVHRLTLSVIVGSLALGLSTSSTFADAPAKKFWVFVGTYTGGKSKGIYRMALDSATGKLSDPVLAAELDNPSFLAVHPSQKYLYAVNETTEPGKPGGVTAFALDASTGTLKMLNRQSSGGDGPCHLVVDSAGKNVLVANYGGGSVAVLPIGPDGKLAPASEFIQHKGKVADAQRQGSPHAHSINLDKANKFAVVADLGLDRVFVYKFDGAKGTLTPNEPPAVKLKDRTGPRHFAFHPDGTHAYVINEIDCTVTAFDYDADRGILTEIQRIPTMPIPVEPKHSTAEIVVHPTGKFVYGSNRGHDSLVVYAVDPSTGRLTLVENEPTGGQTPRNFAVDPTGSYVLAENQSSDSIVMMRIDAKTGALEPTGQVVTVGSPCCVKFVPIPE